MSWHKDILQSSLRKELIAAGSILIILLILSAVQFFRGEPFSWQNITIFSTPDFWQRAFWSALTFATLGWVLYKIYFYKILSWIFGNDRTEYQQVKKIVWLGLMYVNYQIFPTIIDILNGTVSILFNIILLSAYLAPALLTSLILGLALGVLIERKQISELMRISGNQ